MPAIIENPSSDSSVSNVSGANHAAVSSGTASESMLRAAEAASSAANQPAGSAGTPASAAGMSTPGAISGATGQPASAGTMSADGSSVADAPAHRIEAAVRNAREQTRREVEQHYQAFQGMNPQEVQMSLQLLTELRSNPARFLQELAAQVNGDQRQTPSFPEADLVSKDGVLKTYSAGSIQKILDSHGQQVREQVLQELSPFIDYARTEQAQRQMQQAQSVRERQVSDALAEARQLPHFTKENEPAILERLQAVPEERRRQLGPIASLHLAYSTFLKEAVFPTIDSRAEQRVREAFAKKANAGSGQAHPTDQGGDPQKPALRNERDLARHMERLAAAATG